MRFAVFPERIFPAGRQRIGKTPVYEMKNDLLVADLGHDDAFRKTFIRQQNVKRTIGANRLFSVRNNDLSAAVKTIFPRIERFYILSVLKQKPFLIFVDNYFFHI